MKLLTRDSFRELTLARNGGKCVLNCGEKAVDAHHILNRNLFTEAEEFGGYFLENGAGLCSAHHLQAEATLISCETLYSQCNIQARALPLGFDKDLSYDTWGNVIVSESQRLKGPLFNDSGFQSLAKKYNLLWLFWAS